jgi:hypothetical protein
MNIIQGILVLYTGEKKGKKRRASSSFLSLSLHTRPWASVIITSISLSTLLRDSATIPLGHERKKKLPIFFIVIYAGAAAAAQLCVFCINSTLGRRFIIIHQTTGYIMYREKKLGLIFFPW